MSKYMTLKPRLSEKSYGLSQANRTYIFEVPADASKQSVAEAVSAQYGVTVTNVNVARVKGKTKRTFINRQGKFIKGTRSDVKKAYITLKEGDKLPIFAAEEEQEAKEQKAAEKEAKKAKKAEAK